ncbi:MAG: ArnT family glycosyltransferase [Pseudomonadota bacterium]
MTASPPPPATAAAARRPERLAFALILVLTVLRVIAQFSSPFELYPDEAQYWLWSRTLDFGYFSKPPMVAWAIWATTHLGGGDAEGWVRLSAPIFHGVAAAALFAVGRRLYGGWTGLAAAAVYALMPGVQQSSFIISTDAPLLCFLSLALLAYVSAADRAARWAPAGLGAALGLAMLSKYAAVFAVAGIGLHLLASPEARAAWDGRRALAASAAFALALAPNLVWNATHGFATVGHTAANANLGGSLVHPGEMLGFLVEQFGVFGPIPFGVLAGVGLILAIRRRLTGPDLLLACWTAPPLAAVLVQAFLSRANANWAASAYVAGSVLAAAWLTRDWPGRGRTAARVGLVATVVLQGALAAFFIAAMIQPRLVDGIGQSNSIKRLRGWEDASRAVIERARLEALNGGVSAIAVDDRFLFNSLAYYGRDYFAVPDAPPLKVWVRGRAGNQAEVQAPLTPDLGNRVVLAILDDVKDRRLALAGRDFARTAGVSRYRDFTTLPCPPRAGESEERYNRRCLRRVTLLVAEGYRPAAE